MNMAKSLYDLNTFQQITYCYKIHDGRFNVGGLCWLHIIHFMSDQFKI